MAPNALLLLSDEAAVAQVAAELATKYTCDDGFDGAACAWELQQAFQITDHPALTLISEAREATATQLAAAVRSLAQEAVGAATRPAKASVAVHLPGRVVEAAVSPGTTVRDLKAQLQAEHRLPKEEQLMSNASGVDLEDHDEAPEQVNLRMGTTVTLEGDSVGTYLSQHAGPGVDKLTVNLTGDDIGENESCLQLVKRLTELTELDLNITHGFMSRHGSASMALGLRGLTLKKLRLNLTKLLGQG
eukprot:CAMPEP_0204339648 /NCGR_PEP_ID=MMETSP0469-20131031/21971_1 /ASSEMBLY_ACC=CAM_ASM_000384 /TAXON_ID=2969 /ORGANISM="Oxyrrhis marina" /LENGTH=245 /DNA_ID=CAMNT_0051324025 /DNA_START=4 /DNA_END=738 /DNA_ORIENTATION=+